MTPGRLYPWLALIKWGSQPLATPSFCQKIHHCLVRGRPAIKEARGPNSLTFSQSIKKFSSFEPREATPL